QTLSYAEHVVPRGACPLYAREDTGEYRAIVLMYGFADKLHLFDRLLPWLSASRRVVTFDFLGWGASDKPAGYPYTATNQVGDLDAVIEQLKLEQVVLVAHDASGPPAIDWALAHPDRVASLVLLNTYYCAMPTFRPPVRIIFGASDPYLNAGVARRFHELFPTSELFLLPGAYHYVQIDEPERVAHLLLSTPLSHEA